MRNLTLFVASLGLVLGLSLSSAQATNTVNLVWTSTTGTGTTGSSTIDAAMGDTLTLTVSIQVDTAGIAGWATSYSWSPGVINHQLSVLNGANGYQVTGNGAVSNGAGNAPGQLAGSFIFGGINGPATITQGDMTFVAGMVGSTSITTSVSDPVDGIANIEQQMATGNTTFNSATINVVPEPGTAALLALGLGAPPLSGRRRGA